MKEALIEALDESGNPIGKQLTKAEIHLGGYWHNSVHVWIFDNDGKILIQKRAKDKDTAPDKYDISCAGHVDMGEEPIDACAREIREEIGLDINKNNLKLRKVVKRSNYVKNSKWQNNQFNYEFFYKCEKFPENFTLEKEEVAEIRLLDIDEFEKEIDDLEIYKKYANHGLDYYHKVISQIKSYLN